MEKSNINLGSADKFIGWNTPGYPKNCYDYAVGSLKRHGISYPGVNTQVFKLLYEDSNGKLKYFGSDYKQNYQNAIDSIDRHLEKGRPILVGLNHSPNYKAKPSKPGGINEGATDHFVLIYGREFINGYMYYMYYENARSHASKGFNHTLNRFKYDPDGPSLYNTRGKSEEVKQKGRYDVTQIRPNDGNTNGTVSQYAEDKSGGKNNFNPKKSSGDNSDAGDNVESQYSNDVSGLNSAGTDSSDTSNDSSGSGAESWTTSFGTDVVFGQVFPNDDNNRYIEMRSDDISIIQYSEPVLKVEDFTISGKSEATSGVTPDRISYFIPVVVINDFLIPQTNITNFCLDYSSFAPQVMVEFIDMTNDLLSTNIPKPGSYIKVLIDGLGDRKYYKPIRQDFVITSVNKTNKTGGEYQNYPNASCPIKYRLTGILNVPLGFRKMTWSSSKINARQAMFNISNTAGIGFATNFATNNHIDVMRWINTQNKSYYDFMREITLHSCYSPYTFFTSFIDQYYVLNYVECHRLLSHGGNKKDLPQMIYNCMMPDMEGEEKKTDENLESGEQKLSYYFLTNSAEFKGWTNYIEEYFELNDGHSIVSDGYSKVLTYSDKCGFPDLSSKNYKFLMTPIDNLKRDNSKNIVSLPNNVSQDSYIPLNLRQTTNSAYVETQKMYDNPTVAESRIDLGEVDTSNTFPLYFYASVQNEFQMKNLKKCGLSVRLQNYNPAITRYSRIWVDIYDMHRNSTTQIREKEGVDDMKDSKIKKHFENKNKNIISYKDEMKGDTDTQVYNRSLSGWYVVTDMKISYNSVRDFKGNVHKKLQTQLVLNRIEYRPTFHSEYKMAKDAIEKYKKDNRPDDIMCGGDII